MFDDSIRDLLGFNARTLYEEYNLSPNPVDIISFNNSFIETDIAKGMIFKGKRSGIIKNFTMSVSPEYKYVCRFNGGMQWYMMESKDVISSISFKSKKKTKITNWYHSTDNQYHSDYQLKKLNFQHNKCLEH